MDFGGCGTAPAQRLVRHQERDEQAVLREEYKSDMHMETLPLKLLPTVLLDCDFALNRQSSVKYVY